MYNRYIPGTAGYTRITEAEQELTSLAGKRRTEKQTQQHRGEARPREKAAQQAFAGNLNSLTGLFGGEDKNAGIAGILKALKLEDLDSGDILLLLIMLFLFLEGDNIELVITLGLMLLLGLNESKEKDSGQNE